MQLQGHPWAESALWLPTADSTNNAAKMLAAQGAPHGTVVLADHQTAGKGRLGRAFSSPAGMGIYCSVVLRYDVEPERLFVLTPVMAEATREAVEAVTGLQPQIKWINDLVLHGRKLCGILTELGVENGTVSYVVVGVGINCGQQEGDFPPELRQTAISLRQALGRPVDREALTLELIRRLQLAADTALQTPVPWMDAYRQHCVTVGKDVLLLRNEERREAHVDGIDDRGALLVTLPDGTKETVFSGEASVRGLNGYI